jgi:tetratricopeptide (TPR) repeat protein
LESANPVFLMLISVPKVALCYFAICAAIGTTAFTLMTDANRAPVGLAADSAQGPIAAIRSTAQSAAVVDHDQPQPLTPMQLAATAFQSGETARSANQASVALTHYGVALEISQEAGNRQYEAMIWQRIAKTYGAAQDYQRAETYYKTAIAIGTETQATIVLGEAQTELAQLYEQQGDRVKALPLYRQALANLRSVGDHQTAAIVAQQTTKIAASLAPPAKPQAAKLAKVPAAKVAKLAKTPTKPAPKSPKPKAVTPHPVINVAIEPESIDRSPESIDWGRDDVTQDPAPPALDGAM